MVEREVWLGCVSQRRRTNAGRRAKTGAQQLRHGRGNDRRPAAARRRPPCSQVLSFEPGGRRQGGRCRLPSKRSSFVAGARVPMASTLGGDRAEAGPPVAIETCAHRVAAPSSALPSSDRSSGGLDGRALRPCSCSEPPSLCSPSAQPSACAAGGDRLTTGTEDGQSCLPAWRLLKEQGPRFLRRPCSATPRPSSSQLKRPLAALPAPLHAPGPDLEACLVLHPPTSPIFPRSRRRAARFLLPRLLASPRRHASVRCFLPGPRLSCVRPALFLPHACPAAA